MNKSQIDWAVFENEYYLTNNLMFDVQTQPWAVTWQPVPGTDPDKPLPDLIYADTLTGEVLPTERIQFVQYNLHYRNPGFYDLLDELNEMAVEDDKPLMYLMPLIWPVDSADVARETAFFNDVWPVFNGRYTNPDILTASIEGLPLGDLNWFPELKALWEENRDLIDDHMRATNEERIIITSADRTPEKLMPSISIYPNPARDYVRLSERVDRVSIYNVTGSLVKSIQMVEQVDVSELPIGIYFFKLQNGMNASTQKVIVAK